MDDIRHVKPSQVNLSCVQSHRRAGPCMRACRSGLLLLQVLLEVEVQIVVLHRVRRDWRSSPRPLAERSAGREAAQGLPCYQPPPKRLSWHFMGLVPEAHARGSARIDCSVPASRSKEL